MVPQDPGTKSGTEDDCRSADDIPKPVRYVTDREWERISSRLSPPSGRTSTTAFTKSLDYHTSGYLSVVSVILKLF